MVLQLHGCLICLTANNYNDDHNALCNKSAANNGNGSNNNNNNNKNSTTTTTIQQQQQQQLNSKPKPHVLANARQHNELVTGKYKTIPNGRCNEQTCKLIMADHWLKL
ncbi:unnamed protein product [Polarella glacialis]|uniref:Uncharacterized protein n=1 Tax=Polarella glacialis TaxID=89957 RepID=A0A813H7Z3_POLGL|nr:unnamed protein product [Polarella glacialis]